MTFLALAVAAPNTAAALAAMARATGVADLVELRLDLMGAFDLTRLLAARPLPVIVTCRPPREGGKWLGGEAERLELLHQAAELGAEYVDLEWDVAAEASRLNRGRTQVILSRHDFDGIPADPGGLAAAMWAQGADVVKIVGTAHSLADILPILRLLAEASGPTIAIAMGAAGLLTRLLAFRYPQAFLSFAAPDPPSWAGLTARPLEHAHLATAPGQVGVTAMRERYRVKAMAGNTVLIGLVAPSANGSNLLAEGNTWLAQQRQNAILVPLQLEPGEDAGTAVAQLCGAVPFAGFLLDPPFDSGRENVFLVDRDGRFVEGARKNRPVERLEWLLRRSLVKAQTAGRPGP